MAGGFTIKEENIDSFRELLISSFDKKHKNSPKEVNLYLDSVIAPSAINEEFFNDINTLAPFGSGNNEPKFVIENIKLVSSKIVSDKHIKSILCGKDGSVIKTFAWNAKNGPLEILLTKKNKIPFNIAGKLRMNEWKGKKNIEFIIEDISKN